ncbi:MAG: carbohydrate kinase [Verrucomicrobia bacterium]|nr:carbohydrate kinase [Verrucomicrobiota bacterium]
MAYTVVGIGELLWDVFPESRRMGGAPVNFAFHCSQLGARGIPVSRIGKDPLGDEIIESVRDLGLGDTFIQRDAIAPTGTVQVILDERGKPDYDIRENVAWDSIAFDESLQQLASEVDAVCFGSLAQRSDVSRDSIQRFIRSCPEDSIRIFDVNLRQSFYSPEVIRTSLQSANVLKVSDEELPVLAQICDLRGDVADQLHALVKEFALRMAVYTRGAQGSMLVTPDRIIDHPGFAAVAVDTVGAGDSYVAALCSGLLRKRPLESVIENAGLVASYVCEQTGATPQLPDQLKRNIWD